MPAESAFMARRILVVDDELYVTQLLAFILRRVGDEVSTADEGELACQQAVQLQPDLIIADYQMPLIDGIEMCRRLKANPVTANIPVLMLTARGPPIDASRIAIHQCSLPPGQAIQSQGAAGKSAGFDRRGAWRRTNAGKRR